MSNLNPAGFLLHLCTEIERSFQCPVIFFTETDFAEPIYNSLLKLTQEETVPSEEMLEIVKTFHFEWLKAIKTIEKFRKSIRTMPHDVTVRAIDFTIKCLENRYNYLNSYVKEMQSPLSHEEKEIMAANLDIISELRQIHHNTLREKKENILKQADQKEYLDETYNAIEDLMTWLDWQYEILALQYIDTIDLKVPIIASDLTKILRQIIEEISKASDPDSQRISSLIQLKNKTSHTMPVRTLQDLEITRLIIKIKALEDRINKLKDSSALLALQHRTMYLKGKVESLQNMQPSVVQVLEDPSMVDDHNAEERIFNHTLLPMDRARLVEKLLNIWESAILMRTHESIISILSVADLKEVFSDAVGQFTVDKYGRKIYMKDNMLYQLNEKNILVPVNDDDHRPYFYDDCGRYYLNAKSERVYKAHENASEYLLNNTGILFKIKEVINGTEYFYDCLGRYYLNKNGKHIYQEKGRDSEYEYDGVGNLVKLTTTQHCHETYVKKPLTIEENLYLQQAVGPALKKCIANVILHRPNDPIAYLVDSLVKYKQSMDEERRNVNDEKERLASALLYTTKENSPATIEFNLTEYEMPYDIQEGEDY